MAVVNGGVLLGDDVFVGSNSTIVHGVKITNDVVIAAGSTVVSDIEESGIYAGTPARLIDRKRAAG